MKEHQLPANYRISVKALIRDEQNRILLVKEGEDEWGIPGGGLDHGESVEQALRREMREELGAEVAWYSSLPILAEPGYVPEQNRWKFWVTYEVKLASEPKPGADVVEIGWFRKDELKGIALDSTETQNVIDTFHLLSS